MPGSENPTVSTGGLQSRRSLEERVLWVLETANPRTVEEVVDVIRREEPLLAEEIKEITEILRKLNEKGKIQLIELATGQPSKAASHTEDASIQYGNIWLYLVLSSAVATLAAVYLLPPGDALVPVRWALGTLLVTFLPGYATVQALFPGPNPKNIERFAFSLALSLAIVSVTAFLLNYTPWGVRLDPVVTTLVMYTACVALIAAYRKRRRGRNR